jgi:1,4-dihydroxy-2-naphthoate octaprenyltransferase
MAPLSAWISAARMRILPASAIPTCIGIVLAAQEGHFDLFTAFITLLCAMMLQTTSNLLNDLYDFKHGADFKRIGPPRAVASGAISEKSMRQVSWIFFMVTFAIGLILVQKAGWPILLIGVFSLWGAFAYTGGPYPLAYHALGEACAFVFYGIIPVWGSYYIQIPGTDYTFSVGITGIIMGLFAAKILLVNNIRDIETDPPAGKITLAVHLGEKKSRIFYIILMSLSYILLLLLAYYKQSLSILLPLVLIPFALSLSKNIMQLPKAQLTSVLQKTAIHLFAFGLLLGIGIVLSIQF